MMKDVLTFLEGIQKNNTKEWMEANKADYLKAKQQFEDIIKQLVEKISDFDPHIIGTEPKKCIFRLHRDIRFSKDKRPYKENMGGFINREGRKGPCSSQKVARPRKCRCGGSENPIWA